MLVRYTVMSKLGLVEPLMRWQRRIDLGRPAPARERGDRNARAARLAVRRAS